MDEVSTLLLQFVGDTHNRSASQRQLLPSEEQRKEFKDKYAPLQT
jgi:hypothetical protein